MNCESFVKTLLDLDRGFHLFFKNTLYRVENFCIGNVPLSIKTNSKWHSKIQQQ